MRGVHGVMTPSVFGMENFDTTGKYRTNRPWTAVDASGDLAGTNSATSPSSARDAQRRAVLGPCAHRARLYANALGRKANEIDGPALDRLSVQFRERGNRVDQMLVDLVTSDSFRIRRADK